jgi:CheY-like chemotaxis protein
MNDRVGSHGIAGRLLLVDDSALSLEVVADLLQAQGWTVETAETGAEALARMASFSPEVVVCDLQMPDLDGLEVSRGIHQIDRTVPVVVLSGEESPQTREEAMRAGVFCFVPKTDCLTALPEAAARAAAHCRRLRRAA